MKKLVLFFMLFFTLIGYAQFPEGFEDTAFANNATPPATGWATFTNGIVPTNVATNNWQKSNVQFRGGAFSARTRRQTGVTNAVNSLQWLVSPAVTVPANGQVRFYTKKASPGVDYNGQLAILVSTTSQTDPTTFVPITVPAAWNESQISTSWEQKFVLLAPQFTPGQNIFIALVYPNLIAVIIAFSPSISR